MRTGLLQFEELGAGAAFHAAMCERLSESVTFGDLPWPDLQTLAKYIHAYRVPAGAMIFAEGESGSFLCLLLAGRVEIVKEDHEGVARVVATVGPGRAIGEMAVIDGETRSAACLVCEAAEIAVLTKTQFEALVGAYPVLGNKLLLRIARLLSQRLRLASGMLVDYLGQ